MAAKKKTNTKKKAAKKKLGHQAKDFFDATDRFIDSGERVIKAMDGLDRLIRGGMNKVFGQDRPRIKKLEEENDAMRAFISALLEEAGEDVAYPTCTTTNFDIVLDSGYGTISAVRRK